VLDGAVPAPPKETTVDKSIEQMDQDLTCAAYAMSDQVQYLKTVTALAIRSRRRGLW
jgi:hypothetical protein